MPVLQAQRDPQIDFVILADAAQCVNGKLYMLGAGWSEMRSPTFPTIGNVGIALRILFDPSTSVEEYDVKIAILGEDNTDIIPPIKAKIVRKGTSQTVGRPDGINFAANIGLQLQQPGPYRFRVSCGEASKEIEFEAVMAAH